jgi:hypothetical protein
VLNQGFETDGLKLLTRGLLVDTQTQSVYRLLGAGLGFELFRRTNHYLAISLASVDFGFVPPENPYRLTRLTLYALQTSSLVSCSPEHLFSFQLGGTDGSVQTTAIANRKSRIRQKPRHQFDALLSSHSFNAEARKPQSFPIRKPGMLPLRANL